jgi:phosphatidylglycerol:prolipoprotein diacylglycerol transferase
MLQHQESRQNGLARPVFGTIIPILNACKSTKEKTMHPIAFVIGSLTIRWYGVMIAVSIAISITVIYFESRHQGLNTDDVLDMAIVAIIGGILGARIGWIMTSPTVLWYLAHPLRILAIWEGGLSYFGGILGGVIAANWLIRRRRMRFWQMADIVAPLLALSFGIGKIGCWLNGCCNGTATTSGLGVIFTNPLSQSDILNQGIWPAQLFNSASGFLVFAVLFWVVRKRKHYDGQVFIWYLYLYGATSFVVEFFRYIPVHVLGLTPNQWTDITIIILGIIASVILMRRPSVRPMPPEGSETLAETTQNSEESDG